LQTLSEEREDWKLVGWMATLALMLMPNAIVSLLNL
jgi:hypothetical protein